MCGYVVVCVGVHCDVVNVCVGARLQLVVIGCVYVSVFRRLVAGCLKKFLAVCSKSAFQWLLFEIWFVALSGYHPALRQARLLEGLSNVISDTRGGLSASTRGGLSAVACKADANVATLGMDPTTQKHTLQRNHV